MVTLCGNITEVKGEDLKPLSDAILLNKIAPVSQMDPLKGISWNLKRRA